jgi:hypothetical protein
MACLTPEQLTALVLGLDDGAAASHERQCSNCQAKLADLRRVMHDLATAHAALVHDHAASRAALLSQLSHVERPLHSSATSWKRFAFGSIGATAAAALLLAAFFATSFNQLSAMERMVKAIREVRSFSFHQLNTTTYLDPSEKSEVVRHEIGYTCWRAPSDTESQWLGDLYADIKSWRVTPDRSADTNEPPKEKLQLYLSETYPSGKPGMIIVYSGGYYFWTPPVRADEILNVSPMMKLRAVREGAGRIVRELGTRTIDGRQARGYLMDFEGERPFLEMGPVEVWLDPETDLPMEISYEWNKERDKYRDVYRMTDIRWNVDFPPNRFATIAPAGLINATPPTDEAEIDQILAALRIYAELSGGKYPRVRTAYPGSKSNESDAPDLFDPKALREEMLGFTNATELHGTESADRASPTREQIDAASAGLERLGCVLLNHHRAGYFGDAVGPQDKDKVLLWWAAGTQAETGGGDQYRVFYGDLQTEILPREKWLELMPPEFQELL